MFGKSANRAAALGAMVVGIAAGSYGIASAASGSSSASSDTTATATTAAPTPAPSGAPPGASAQDPWGRQRSDETLLTGDALAKVTAIAREKVPGGTIVRVETDADGNGTYEAHMTRADGSPVTVYVDSTFQYVSTQ